MNCAPSERNGGSPVHLSRALRSVTSAPRERYFETLVRELAQHLGVAFAFVAELAEENPMRARTIARFGDGQILPNAEYLLDGTPCHDVIRQGFTLVRDGATTCFPLDTALGAMGVESYAGIALVDDIDRKSVV